MAETYDLHHTASNAKDGKGFESRHGVVCYSPMRCLVAHFRDSGFVGDLSYPEISRQLEVRGAWLEAPHYLRSHVRQLGER